MRGAFCSSVPSFLNSSVYTVTHAASIRESRGGLGVCACAPGDTTPAMERTNGANSATGLMEHPSYSLQQSLRRPRRVADYGDRRPLKADLAQKALRSEEHTSELQSLAYLVCRLLLEKKKKQHCWP